MSESTSSPPARALHVRDAAGDYHAADPTVIIGTALQLCERRLAMADAMTSPAVVKAFLGLRLAALEHEVFCVLWLDCQHRVIAFRELFRGTLTQTSVYPREVVKEALAANACAVILAHNHPSGCAEPSRADELLTAALKAALALVDVQLVDHLVVGGAQCVSFAERGLL